ncbi:peptidase inhibitor 16 [Echinococcus multilocularis]|uniref:Peptidase inhibitor 16 n=1 Tax=Echinococcus multilocularis TaxID=6211 RepID=A0A068YNT9_ECHMU|nr:peptidase inhibitor 16 [Echinococcus multilocularis]
MKFLIFFLALLSYACANKQTEEAKAALIEIHESTRGNFTFPGRKLAPLNYSKDLERLAEQWVDACKKAPPTDPRFANLGSTVITTPLFDSLVDKWRYHMSSGRRNYNPAIGECTAFPCEHFRQVVQPNNTSFGCAIKVCVPWTQTQLSANLSVCLYQAKGQKEPIQQTAGPPITTAITMTATATLTTPKRNTTVVAKSDTSSKPPPSASTNPLKATHVPNHSTDLPIEEEDEGAEEAEEARKLIASMEITVETVKSSMNSQPHFVVNGAEMEEAENEKGVEEEDKEAGRTSESTKLSLHLIYLGVIATIIHS